MNRATPSVEIDCLEWSWNMKYHTLNVDTRNNVQTVRTGLHRWYDMTEASKPVGWFWFPDDFVIRGFHSTYVGAKDIDSVAGRKTNARKDPFSFYTRPSLDTFRYRLIPLPGMAESWSVKRYTGNPFSPFDPELLLHYKYPFENLPICDLHIPYHFVIVNTGKKLQQLYGTEPIEYDRDFPFLADIDRLLLNAVRNVYVAWMDAQPSSEFYRGDDDAHLDHTIQNQGEPSGDMGVESSGGRGKRVRTDGAFVTVLAPGCSSVTKSLAPWDSVSNVEVDFANDGEDPEPFVDDEHEEEEDKEWFEAMKEWVKDVWAATHDSDTSDGSDSEKMVVDVEVMHAIPEGGVTNLIDGTILQVQKHFQMQ
ncbi:hypothetical protein K435DRAFT_742461 [Dendrothele bispora CBS 962.96]|uniref:Uncharacterized protein n=1 Tax=Dendrothele bispora (strain CBS 962.96) TaxID=1314807 RepID=A0A4S8MVQ1_DENBC|nr:hypothetical protein K435DRAFT_742461 [Dendrothele bispora CBS 962.96]